MMKGLSLLLIAVSVLTTSCSFKIQALPPSGVPVYEGKLPYDAAIYIPPDVASRTVTRGGLCCIGVIHSWEMLVGNALMTYSGEYFDGIFRSARVYKTKQPILDNESLKVAVVPYVKDLRVSQGLQISLNLHCIIRDRQDKILYEKGFTGRSKGDQAMGKACIGGVMLGESALRGSFSSALNDSFQQLITDLRCTHNWKKLKAVSE